LNKLGKLDHMKSDANFEGCVKVFTALGFDTMELELHKTAEPI